MNDFNQIMLVVAYSSFAVIACFIIWLTCFYKNPTKKALIYATACKNKGIDRDDTIDLVAHYLEWEVKVLENDGIGTSSNRSPKVLANDMAHTAVEIAFSVERTKENTKPRIRIPAEIE